MRRGTLLLTFTLMICKQKKKTFTLMINLQLFRLNCMIIKSNFLLLTLNLKWKY